jgi:hypothetical protein
MDERDAFRRWQPWCVRMDVQRHATRRQARAGDRLRSLVVRLGIGANSTIFTLANAMLFRPMPGIAAPERLVWVSSIGLDARPQGLSVPEYLDYREATGDMFAGVLGFQSTALSVGSGEPRRVRGHLARVDPVMALRTE